MLVTANSWRPRGHVYLWRYRDNTRNYPGWHLSADRPGGASILELLGALELAAASAHRTIPLSPPTLEVLRVPNNQGGAARIWAPTKWRVVYDPSTPSRWEFPIAEDPAVLTLGPSFLAQLSRGVSDLLRGSGDYSIASTRAAPSESTELWFWW